MLLHADKMDDVAVEQLLHNAPQAWQEALARFPDQLVREILVERPHPTEEDIAWVSEMELRDPRPVEVALTKLLQNKETLQQLTHLPIDVVDAISAQWDLDLTPGEVYDRTPARYLQYAKLSGAYAKPSVMLDGEIIWGVGRFVAALLRGDRTLKVWDMRRSVSAKRAAFYHLVDQLDKRARLRLAAEPAADTWQDVVDEKQKGEKPAPTKKLPWIAKPIINGLTKKTQALIQKYQLNAAQLTEAELVPQIEDTGIDITYRLLSPSFKGALLTFSWTKREGIKSWLKKLGGLQPDQVTLYFCKSIYLALPAQIAALLSALSTIQGAMMRAGTAEETEIYKLVPDPKSKDKEKQQGREQAEDKNKQERLIILVTQLQSADPRLDISNAAKVLEEAKYSQGQNNITKDQLKELYDFIKKNGQPGWEKLVEDFGKEAAETSYKTVATEEEIAKLVTQLTAGKYKGKPQVGYYSEGGKSFVTAVLNAPFPFHFRFERLSGGKLRLDGAGAKICQNDYSVEAPEAKDLLWAVLTLGVAAKQAAQVPEEIRNRGRRRQELSEDEAAEVEELQNELDPKRKKKKAPVYSGTLYPVVVQQMQKLLGKTLSPETAKKASDLLKQRKVSSRDLGQLFKTVVNELGIEKVPQGTLQALITAVETAANPNHLTPEVETALRTLLGA